jgi:hypothetical protein
MLTPTEKKFLILRSLSETEQIAAAGRISDPPVLKGDDVARSLAYFDKDLTAIIRKISLSSANSILFSSNGSFKILSCPKLALDATRQEIFIGHDGIHPMHPSPISIKANVATANVMALIPVSPDPMDPTALHELAATRYITDVVQGIEHNADGDDEEVELAFPFPPDIMDPDDAFASQKVAALPLAVPLPPGHDIDPVAFDDECGLAAFLDKLSNIGQEFVEWANAFLNANEWWHGQSLHATEFAIPVAFTEGLPDTNPYSATISISMAPVQASSAEGLDLFCRLSHIQNDNIDRWFTTHPDIYQEHARRYSDQGPDVPNAAPTPAPQVIFQESLKDKTTKVNIARAKTVTELMLVREGTNAAGAPILVPGKLSTTFQDALQDTPSRALRTLLQYFNSLILSKTDDLNIVNVYKAKFPTVMVTSAFVATYTNGYWATLPLQQEANMIGQSLTIFSFAPARTGTDDHKRQIDESNAILGEELVGTANSQRTKASLQLYGNGPITTYQSLLSTIANLLLVLEAADAPNQDSPSILIKNLEDYFKVLIKPNVRTWIEHFQRTPAGEHLPHSLAVDIHNNCLIQMAQFANHADWGRAVLEKTDIPTSALEAYQHLRSMAIVNWSKCAQASTLGPYISPTATWVSPKAAKDAKKAAKTNDTSSPSSKQNRTTATNANTNQPTASSRSTTPGTSNPDFGMLVVPDNIRNGPQLPSGKRLCLLFTAKGRTCTNGYNCPNAHVTMGKASITELQAIERWVTNTAAVSWANGRPRRLTDNAQSTPSSSPAPSRPAAAQASPPAAAADGTQG